jgi:RNA polymerase sigma-70 factor (ECF subfamily)
LLIDHWRRSDLEQAYLHELAQLPEPCTPTLEEQQLTLELLNQVARLLEGLRPRVRRAFLLAQLDGMKYADIAAQLGISQRSVERHVADALLHCYQLRYGGDGERSR